MNVVLSPPGAADGPNSVSPPLSLSALPLSPRQRCAAWSQRRAPAAPPCPAGTLT